MAPAQQSAMCLGREDPQDCGNQTSSAEEAHQPGCPQGSLCPDSPPGPCPPGTFLSREGPHNTPLCHRCPRGFFNPWPGQDACFPCGSEATQPEEGKDTCVCLEPGRLFQPSDGQCPCSPGYQDVGEPRGCVQRERKSCKGGAAWNQDGLCLTKDQWSHHCAHEVSVTEGPGSQEIYLLDRPSSPRAVGHPCNLDQTQKPVPLYVVRMDGTGFLGLIRPGHELLRSLGLLIGAPGPPGHDAGQSREGHLTSSWSMSLNSTRRGDLPPPEPGIRNPTVCLQINDTLAFLVTRDHYPEYDPGHFYNTRRGFDWGRLRALAEESQLQDQEPYLFLQQFQEPGVYVFRLSSNRHRKMYIRTLPPGGRCFGEGPFAPTTPGYLIQTGIAKIPRPPKRSEWPEVLGETVLLLGFCLLLLVSKAGQVTSESLREASCLIPPGRWGPERQVDLERFDPERFFGILLRQSHSVTTKLGQTKEELKLLCRGLLSEARSLRQLWGAERRIPASTGQLLGSPPSELQQAAEAAARAAAAEAERRGRLAGPYAASLGHQLRLLRRDLRARKEQRRRAPGPPGPPGLGRTPKGGVRTSEAAILPYVPYPTCPATGSPPAARLPVLQPRRTSQLGAVMTDPATGIEVPVLAVTLHPHTRQWLALGGTYCNPLTKTLAPLELGGPMEDPVTGGIWPILGVGLDEDTGQVLALGGLRDASGNLMLPGDSFEEPLSRKTVLLQGAAQQEGRTVPHTGGSQALLDANVLVAQRRVLAVLRSYQERPGSRTQELLEAAIKDMRQALALSLHQVLQQARRLQRQLETADGIAASGGRIGMMCYPGTELWAPAVYGMEIPDAEGSGLMVPILGMETDRNSGDATPLAGSMEDADGKGLVPISIGAQAIDPLTGEPGPVIGAQRDPCSGVVVPVVQVLEALPRGVSDPGLPDALEKERRAREQYWCLQEREEVRLAEHLGRLSQELLSTPGRGAQRQLRAAAEACAALGARRLRETQRRAAALSAQGGPERGLPSQADGEEAEQEAQVALGMHSVLQSLGHAAEKLRQAVGRLRGQEEEMWLQQRGGQSLQPWNRLREVVQHLSDEFQEVLRERQSFLERALGHLQYQRELSRLHLLHTQIVASGTPACLENYPGDRFYGTVTASLRDRASACPLLIPFLKSLTAALVGAQGCSPGPEDQGPGTDADKVDIMWTSPLFSTVKKVDIWSQAHKEEAELQAQMHHQQAPESSLQDAPKPQIMHKEELITVQATDLSAREFVVYQYGLSILDLLIPQLQVPEITLQIASHLPAAEASDNDFEGSFFFQSAENILFVGRQSLASVGSFILLLIRCLAHIAAKDFHQDSNPAFLRSFYKGLQAYFREAFSVTLQMSAVSWDSKLDRSISAILLEEQPTSETGRDLLSKLIERKCESHLEPESSEEYIKKNKDLLLFTNMEHFLKSLLAAEKQISRKQRDESEGEDEVRWPSDLQH
ncbi:uncharacterized protein LOC120229872 [Hyaena hyaena]|uniref:uncharacterized protein LOC120229872 n=1 Tax=Hyaena hyaena TaxID=95912 RepID=UPI001923417B|nr:uncharacterized protein LOC120229872 [Hyaena hyaena]